MQVCPNAAVNLENLETIRPEGESVYKFEVLLYISLRSS